MIVSFTDPALHATFRCAPIPSVLTAEDCAYVLTEVCSSPPDSISTLEEDAAYHKWQKADKLAKCYILASMSNVLQRQHDRMLTA